MSQPSFSPQAAQTVFAHPDALADIPTEPFTLFELPTRDSQRLAKQLADTTVLSTEFVEQDGVRVIQYRLTEQGKERREVCIEDRYRPLPCDHVGLSNLNGDTFECCYDACDRTFDRAEVDL